MITIPGEDKIRHSAVNNFAMTSDGTLWMCTEEGLISFDGVHSMFVKVEDTDAVAKNIKSLIEMPGGRFLIGSNEGLFLKYRDESQEESKRIFPDKIPEVLAMARMPNGNICVASKKGVFILDPQLNDATIVNGKNQTINCMLPVNGKLYLGTDNGLLYLDKNNLSDTGINGLTDIPINLMANIPDKLFLYSQKSGMIFTVNPTANTIDSIPVGNSLITGIVRTPQNEILVATNGDGILRLDPSSKKLTKESGYNLRSKNNVECKQLYSLFVSNDGQLFAGYYKMGGAYSPLNSKFFNYYSTDGFNSHGRSVRSVTDSPRHITIGTRDGAFIVDKSTGKSDHLSKDVLGSNLVISSIYHNGEIYIGTWGGGLSIYNPDSGKIRNATFSSQMPTGITNLRHDRSNNLFACATDGIFMLKDNTFEKIADNTISGEVTNATIFELFFDSSGRSWVGTSKGIFLFDRNVGKLTRNGLPKNFPQNKDVRQMYETTARNLIMITDSGEIMVFDENLRQSAHQANLSAINEARGVAQDSNGYAWITSINGLWRYGPEAQILSLYDDTEGVENPNFNPGRPIITQSGDLLLCNTEGLLYANIKTPGETRMGHRKAYPVIIETADGRTKVPRKYDDKDRFVIDLPKYESHIKIYFSDFAFVEHNPNRYQYSYDNGKSWNKLDADMSMLMTNLKNGENIIRIRQTGNPTTESIIAVNNKSDGKVPLWLLFFVTLVAIFALVLILRFMKRRHNGSNHTELQSAETTPPVAVEPMVETTSTSSSTEKPAENNDKETASPDVKKKYAANYISEKECNQLTRRMNSLLKETKIYTNPDLKVADIAAKLGVSSHKISYLLSQHLNTTYYDFIYAFRVEEFKYLAKADKKHIYSLTALAEKAGFNSRATFFRAFKKSEGITPGEYLKNLREES